MDTEHSFIDSESKLILEFLAVDRHNIARAKHFPNLKTPEEPLP